MANLKNYLYVACCLAVFEPASASLMRQSHSVEELKDAYLETLRPLLDDRRSFEDDLERLRKAREKDDQQDLVHAQSISNQDRSIYREDIQKALQAAKNICEALSEPSTSVEEASFYCASEPEILGTLEQAILKESLESSSFENVIPSFSASQEEDAFLQDQLKRAPALPLIKEYAPQ